jgi:hypothetical protein
MMTFSKVAEYITSEPFRPFRIHMASGRTFDVRHPEMVMLGRITAKIYSRHEENDSQAPHWQEASLMLMESIEPLEPVTR